jgi:hypothetical protein
LNPLERFLSPIDTIRACRALEKLSLHGLREFALTGGLATEIQLRTADAAPRLRHLNDIDVVVRSFDSIPQTIAEGFLFRHIHPKAAFGQTLMQLVDPEQAVRIDVFRECGSTMARCRPVEFRSGVTQLVSPEDLAARIARVLLDLDGGAVVSRKHAEDFRRLVSGIDPDVVEISWCEHRRQGIRLRFQEASARISNLLISLEHLLINPEYSQDLNEQCQRCEDVGHFRCAPRMTILSILGYC